MDGFADEMGELARAAVGHERAFTQAFDDCMAELSLIERAAGADSAGDLAVAEKALRGGAANEYAASFPDTATALGTMTLILRSDGDTWYGCEPKEAGKEGTWCDPGRFDDIAAVCRAGASQCMDAAAAFEALGYATDTSEGLARSMSGGCGTWMRLKALFASVCERARKTAWHDTTDAMPTGAEVMGMAADALGRAGRAYAAALAATATEPRLERVRDALSRTCMLVSNVAAARLADFACAPRPRDGWECGRVFQDIARSHGELTGALDASGLRLRPEKFGIPGRVVAQVDDALTMTSVACGYAEQWVRGEVEADGREN